jgi:hypothetical protein
VAEGTRCPPPRIATEHDSTAFFLDHTDTGGVGLTDALEVLDGPEQWDGSTNAAGATRPRPVSGWGRTVSERVVWETCLRCGDLAAIVSGSDEEVAELDYQGGCARTDGQGGELPQRRRSERSLQ